MAFKISLPASLSLLLVPLFYFSTDISDVCAVPPDVNFKEGSCAAPTKDPRDGRTYQTCCWKERVYPYVGEKTVCQTCSRGDNVADVSCGDKVVQLTTKMRPEQRGGILEPSTPFEQAVPNSGILGNLRDSNLTILETDGGANESTQTLEGLDKEAKEESNAAAGEEQDDIEESDDSVQDK